MKKIKIFMLHLGHGGVEKQTITMANALSKNYDIEIISFYKIAAKPAYNINKNISVKYLYNGKPNRQEFIFHLKKLNLIKTFKEGIKSLKILYLKKKLIIKEILKDDADIYFSTRHEYGALLGKYGNKSKIKLTQEHNYIENKKYRKKTIKKLNKLDYIIVISEYHLHMYQEWFKKYPVKIKQIPNILDTDSKTISNLDNNAIIAVGRFNYIKDFSSLIDVMNYATLTNPSLKLYLIGDGEERENLIQKIAKLHLNNNIIMPGFVDSEEVGEYMKKSDLYIMTSYSECFPMVILEAYSYGLPAVSFDILTGPRELINSKTGALIKNRDCKEMATKITEILENKELLKKLGTNAKKESAKYLTKNVIKEWIDIFQ